MLSALHNSARRNTRLGRAGELYVAHILELNGIETHHLSGNFDILAIREDGRLIKVEVKSAAKRESGRGKHRYQYLRGKGCPDVYAFWAADVNMVRFLRAEPGATSKFIRLNVNMFADGEMERDIKELFHDDYQPSDR